MFLPFYIAKRYLVSRKSHNIINIISIISIAGVGVGTMALIVVLSVFNGFEDLVKSLYNTFDPDIRITLKEGKSFDPTAIPRNTVEALPGFISYTEVVEENVLLKHKTEQVIVTLKGVSDDFLLRNPLDSMLYDGDLVLNSGEVNYAIMGYLVAYNLGIKLYDPIHPLVAFVPKRTKRTLTSFEGSFNSGSLTASAVFAIQQEIDSKYVIVPVHFARNLLEYEHGEVTAIEIRLLPGADYADIQHQIMNMEGMENFDVKNRYQQQALLYKIMKSEKWAIFFILTFILIISAFNVIGSISMLILDKRKDIAILSSMGASMKLIKRIFLTEGMFVSLFGAIAGIALGAFLCFLQIQFGLIRLGDANAFIVPYYPVKMQMIDFLAVFLTVLVIGFFSAWYPVKQISSKYLSQRVADFTKNQ